MALLNILNIAAAAFYLYLFITLQRIKIRGREHRILSLALLALFQWTISAYFVYNSANLALLRILLPISCIGMFFFFPLNFHFAYALVYEKPLPRWLALIIYTVATILSATQFFYPISMKLILDGAGSVRITPAVGTPFNLIWLLFALTCWLVPVWFFIRYRKRAVLNRKKRQANLLLLVILLTIVLVLCEYYLLPLIPGWNIPSQSPLLFSFWTGAMVYAIWKYGFLRISPGLLAEKILDSVEDLVILYSTDGNVAYRNRKARAILGKAQQAAESPGVPYHRQEHAKAPRINETGAEPTEVLNDAPKELTGGETEILEKVVYPLLQRQESWSGETAERQFTLHVSVSPKTVVTVRVKPVLDRFDDPLGVLVLGTLVPQLSDALRAYGFTKREQEVLEFLLTGWTISKTARTLFITERTVKAHISRIYAKTGAGNRMELANMLKPAFHKDITNPKPKSW